MHDPEEVTTKKKTSRNKRKAERDPVPESFTVQRMAHIARDYCPECRGDEYGHVHTPSLGVIARCIVSVCDSPSLAKAIFVVSRDNRWNGFVVVKIIDFESKRWWAPEGYTAKYYFDHGGIGGQESQSST